MTDNSNDKRRVLFIAPASIPVNSAEAIVNLKLLKILVSKGYKIDLISKKSKWERYPIVTDESLQNLLCSINILEVDNKFGIRTLWLHIIAWIKFGVFFKGIHWALLASRVAKAHIQLNKYSCVITKNYPSELVGCWIKKRYGIPWVATWNDPYPHERYPSPYGGGAAARLPLFKRPILHQMSKYPDAHIFPSLRLCNYMRSYLHFDNGIAYIIPHIAQPDNMRVKTIDENGVIRICHIGSLDSAREPWTTLNAIESYKKKNAWTHFKVDFIGTTPKEMLQVIKDKKIDDIVRVLAPVSYSDSLELMKGYDVALIIEAPCSEGIFLPSKVSDIMSIGLSIFAISPSKGVLGDLYEKGVIQYFADVSNPISIENEMERMVIDHKNGIALNSSIPAEYLPEAIGRQYDSIIERFQE